MRIAAQNFSSIRPWTDGFHANGRYGRRGEERSRQLSAEISRTEIATYISRRIVFMYIYVCLRPAASSSFRAVIAQLHIRSSNPLSRLAPGEKERKKKKDSCSGFPMGDAERKVDISFRDHWTITSLFAR